MKELATQLHHQGKFDEAAALLREVLKADRETLGNRHPYTLSSIGNLGSLLQEQGDLAGAVLLLREALQMCRKTLGSRHPNTLASINNLGLLLKEQGDLAGAAPLLREALQVSRETLGDRHPKTLCFMGNLGLLLKEQGETVEALALLSELQTAHGGASPKIMLDALRELETRASAGGHGRRGGSAMPTWKKGMRVRLEGLEARPDLNGSVGVLVGGVAESRRAPVKLVASEVHAGLKLNVKPANMRFVTKS